MELPSKMSRDSFMFRFPARLWRIINSCATGSISWGPAGNTIRILRKQFEDEYLTGDAKPFKTSKFESFVRQLNHYGFKKVINPIMHEETKVEAALLSEYYNSNFIKGNPERVAFLVRRSQGNGRKRRKKRATDAAEDESESAEKKTKTDSQSKNKLPKTSSTSETYGHHTKDHTGPNAMDTQLASERDKLLSSTVKYNMMARHLSYPQEPVAPNGNYNHNKYVMSYRPYCQGMRCEPGIYGEPPPWSEMQHTSSKSQFYEDYMTAHVLVPARMSYGPDARPLYRMRTPEECAGHMGQEVEPDKVYSPQQRSPHWDITLGPSGTTEMIGDVYMGRNVIDGHPCYGRNEAGFRKGVSYHSPYFYQVPGHLLHADSYSMRTPYFRSHSRPYLMEREGPFQMETEFQGYQSYPAMARERPSGVYLDEDGSGLWKDRDPYLASSSFRHTVNSGHDYIHCLDRNQSAPDYHYNKDLDRKRPDVELHDDLNVQSDITAELALVVVAEETVVTSNPTTMTEGCTAVQNFAEEETQELDRTAPLQSLLEETNTEEAGLKAEVIDEDLITMTLTSSPGCKLTESVKPSNASLWNNLKSEQTVCTQQKNLLLHENGSEIPGSYPGSEISGSYTASCLLEEAAKCFSLDSSNPRYGIGEAAHETHITVSEVLNDESVNVLQRDCAQTAHESFISDGSVIPLTSDSGIADSLSAIVKGQEEKEDSDILLPSDSGIADSSSLIMKSQQKRDADEGNLQTLHSGIASSPTAIMKGQEEEASRGRCEEASRGRCEEASRGRCEEASRGRCEEADRSTCILPALQSGIADSPSVKGHEDPEKS